MTNFFLIAISIGTGVAVAVDIDFIFSSVTQWYCANFRLKDNEDERQK